jgi:hypothetical protein
MDERIRFVIRLKDGESMAALCRQFQVSRKTGYKIFERYEECGLEGLTDRARRPHRYANQLPEQIEAAYCLKRSDKYFKIDSRSSGFIWAPHPVILLISRSHCAGFRCCCCIMCSSWQPKHAV